MKNKIILTMFGAKWYRNFKNRFRYHKILLIMVGIGWIVLISLGMARLYNYEFKTGPKGSLITHWPAKSRILRDHKIYYLVMVMHPQCPCSRATLHELELIMAKSQNQLSVYMLFTKPKEFSQDWIKTDLYKYAQKIPNVHVLIDEDSQEAKLFGGITSGETFLFDKNGNLLFSGGITGSRGHEGDNVGMMVIIDDIVQNKNVGLKQTPAFGCLLYSDDPQTKRGRSQGRNEYANRE